MNVNDAEVPPPGAGVNTVTWAVPTAAMSPAAIAACSCVLLTNVVARGLPFQFTTDVLVKPDPFTVRVKPPAPANALDGESELATGKRQFAAGDMASLGQTLLAVFEGGEHEEIRTLIEA